MLKNETRNRLKKNGYLDHILHILAVGRYRGLYDDFRYAISKERGKAKLFNGFTINLPNNMEGIGKELLLHGIHEPTATREYEKFLKPGDQILEAGANIGYYVAVAEKTLDSRVNFLAIEPDPDVFEILKVNTSSIKNRIQLQMVAASDQKGESIFFQSSSSNLGSLRKSRRADDKSTIVQTKTIDGLCEDSEFRPTVIRMDIEGAEILALRGARQVLQKFTPRLFIELHPSLMTDDEVREVLDIFESFSYSNFTVIDRSYDQPCALRRMERCQAKKMNIAEIKVFLAERYVTALGLLSHPSA